MKPKNKSVRRLVQFCPQCKEELSGDGSVMLPWKCRCGEWEPKNMEDGNWDYVIIPNGEIL